MKMTILKVALLYWLCGLCEAQSVTPSALLPEAPPATEYSIEDSNRIRAAVTMPLISDTVLGVKSNSRAALFNEGILLRPNILPRISVNLLDSPVRTNQHAYIGQRPTWITGVNPILAADLWRDHHVEIKTGYILNDIESVGTQAGEAIATGPLGVYVKAAAERSLNATGGSDTEQRNQSGFRFIPKGDGHTLYTNKLSGKKESGNECVCFLMNHQVPEFLPQRACHGLYAGGAVMTAVSGFNAYDRYYEARLYQKVPFRSHPDDVLSIVAAYLGRSKYVNESLTAQGKPVWHSSPSMTASYSVHVSHGNYLTIGLGYVRGAAPTQRVADTLTFTTTWSLYL
jgi:hypothetical protein